MTKLNLMSIANINRLASPNQIEVVDLKTNALVFFTDFTQVNPLVIESSMSAFDTMRLMKKAHVRLKIVIDDEGCMLGIVSAEDLLERKMVQKLGKGDKVSDLSVTEFMTPLEKLRVLEYKEIKTSRIADVIGVLKHSGQQHCLVIDSEAEEVRGLFSASDISRKLKVDIDIQAQPSFVKLASKLD